MKIQAVILLACAFSAQAFANNAKCRLVDLSYNTHPDIACPDYVAFCTTELESGDMSIEEKNGNVSKLRFNGPGLRNLSDIGQVFFNSYSSMDEMMHLEVRFEDDGNYPARRIGGYTGMTLSTGVRGVSGVYRSQLCNYKID